MRLVVVEGTSPGGRVRGEAVRARQRGREPAVGHAVVERIGAQPAAGRGKVGAGRAPLVGRPLHRESREPQVGAHEEVAGADVIRDYLDNWRNNDETGNPAPAPGAFIHVVGTYDGTSLALYVNGQSFASYASATTLAATGAPLTAGGVANWGMFTGVLDESANYDEVLPQSGSSRRE